MHFGEAAAYNSTAQYSVPLTNVGIIKTANTTVNMVKLQRSVNAINMIKHTPISRSVIFLMLGTGKFTNTIDYRNPTLEHVEYYLLAFAYL